MSDYIELGALLALFLGYVVYCHRPVQVCSAKIWFDASPEEAIALLSCEPDSGFKLAGLDRVEWIDEARRYVRVTYPNRLIEAHFRNLPIEADGIVRSEGSYFDTNRGVFFDSYRTELIVEPTDGGSTAGLKLFYIRGSIWPFRMMRLVMPLVMGTYRDMVQGALVAKRAEQGRPAPREARIIPSQNGRLI